jgi:tRNA G18 (ribose-2'-O)-methylase SpoU
MIIGKVSDAADPRIAVYRDLKDKHLHRNNAFIVEGKFILETLLTRSRFKVSSILIAEDRLSPLENLLLHVPANVPVYISTPDVLAEIAGFNVHRGILAAGISAQSEVSLPTYLQQKSKIAVLSNISNPDNIGAIFRNAAGLGIEAVILDSQCCNPLYRKAIRVSMGATLVLPWLQSGSIGFIIEQLKSSDFSIYALSLQSATNLEDVEFGKRSAFVFGEEAHGLPSHIQILCQGVTIPMSNGTDSLNVAATSAIVFDAARRQKF